MIRNKTYMIAGLGNPGQEYSQTRHNMGFLVADELARRYSLSFSKSRFDALTARGRIAGDSVVLVKPMSYMNRSGFPVQKVSAYFNIDLPSIIVVHDELDLKLGRIMIVKDRGHGGHNGIRSLIDLLGSRNFIRVRLGVGRPDHCGEKNVTSHVLGRFSNEEKAEITNIVSKAADACEIIISKGVQHAMNTINTNPPS
ncbi:Peptidyl-tRNA hydrolase [Desulfamplus magnetovallimortis]|uniref:Peptidyl-tRNA hydrolase n=1 Tax=Desulfamplus magnetovallimortis TaxID=1246637 RepID=A0A1W1H9E8_9BACT|nr:aminoacyl-tRNA hydrolase [Desulfamplus magnetovallimortis]SLM29035.1 Peptidyl-tRNA hydrolase [Desulfamplus magnetovallimortis]